MSKEIIKKEKTEITEKETKEIQEKNEIEKLRKYIKTFLTHENLSENEIEQFIEVARSQKLDPFKKELHVVAYGEGKYRSLSLITGYEIYLRRADLIPVYDFFETEHLGEFGKPDFRCKIKIYRKDRTRPLIHECYFNEFVGKKKDGITITKFWKKMPYFMIEKVTVAQGLRWAFPNDFENMPYIKEEINEIIDVTPEKKENEKILSNIKKNMDKEKAPDFQVKDFEKEEESPEIIDTTGVKLNKSEKKPEKNEKFNGKIHTVDELFPDEKADSKKSNFDPEASWCNIFDNDRAKNLKDSMDKKDAEYFYALASSGPQNYKEKKYKEDIKIIEDYEKRLYEKGRQ